MGIQGSLEGEEGPSPVMIWINLNWVMGLAVILNFAKKDSRNISGSWKSETAGAHVPHAFTR